MSGLSQRDLRHYLWTLRERMPMWTVYDHPADHPDAYVARLWLTLPHATVLPQTLICREIEPLREELADLGMHRLERNPGDDPVILETWI